MDRLEPHQDQSIRARLEQGDLDSMVNLLLLYGTSFTRIRASAWRTWPRLPSGLLKSRVDDLVAGLAQPRRQ